MPEKIRVLLVDDSGFMRMVLTDIINNHPNMEVIDTAEDGKQAVEKSLALLPDVVLLDLNMKNYDGLYAVKNIMAQRPTPIIMLSSMGNTYPDAYVEALNEGAIDFINKPEGVVNANIREIQSKIYGKILQAKQTNINSIKNKKTGVNHFAHTFNKRLNYEIVAIGASTGGTGSIEQILQKLPENFPLPIVIAQHMPEEFVYSFAARLNQMLPLEVKVAQPNEVVRNGYIYIMPGNANLMLAKHLGNVKFIDSNTTYTEFNHPSVDCLFNSVASVYGSKSIAILLTGMGKDGALGLLEVKNAKGFTIAQDQATSIVWGMPKAAIDLGAADYVLPIHEIATFAVSAIS